VSAQPSDNVTDRVWVNADAIDGTAPSRPATVRAQADPLRCRSLLLLLLGIVPNGLNIVAVWVEYEGRKVAW
jgi:hypothetical protein